MDDVKTTWKAPWARQLSWRAWLQIRVCTVIGDMDAAEHLYGSEHRLFATLRSQFKHRGVQWTREAGMSQAHTGKKESRDIILDGR